MMVLILERVSASVRGDLTRWLLEPKAGVFVGRVPASVRQRLWERATAKLGDGSAIMIWAADTEQGFRIESIGDTRRLPRDFEGLTLITER
jgi:CRISPR-associated protein Cas2